MEIYHCRDTGLSCLGCGQPGRGTGLYSDLPTPLPSHPAPSSLDSTLRFRPWWLWGTSLLTVALENWLSGGVSLSFVPLLP